ncbi:unnamed protein product [Linum trigynum]|uniref:Uncharacterized protein n=1 Tax=Linum trigynum TaxID=586398 RepID=A0AAV2G4N8_9ROSI
MLSKSSFFIEEETMKIAEGDGLGPCLKHSNKRKEGLAESFEAAGDEIVVGDGMAEGGQTGRNLLCTSKIPLCRVSAASESVKAIFEVADAVTTGGAVGCG